MVPLTTNLRLAGGRGNVSVPRGHVGLAKDSVVNVSQVVVVDRNRLVGRAGDLAPLLMEDVDSGLRLVLDL